MDALRPVGCALEGEKGKSSRMTPMVDMLTARSSSVGLRSAGFLLTSPRSLISQQRHVQDYVISWLHYPSPSIQLPLDRTRPNPILYLPPQTPPQPHPSPSTHPLPRTPPTPTPRRTIHPTHNPQCGIDRRPNHKPARRAHFENRKNPMSILVSHPSLPHIRKRKETQQEKRRC